MGGRISGRNKKAKVDQNISFDQLFTEGSQQRMARYPTKSGNQILGGMLRMRLVPEKIKRWKHPEGGFIHALHKHDGVVPISDFRGKR